MLRKKEGKKERGGRERFLFTLRTPLAFPEAPPPNNTLGIEFELVDLGAGSTAQCLQGQYNIISSQEQQQGNHLLSQEGALPPVGWAQAEVRSHSSRHSTSLLQCGVEYRWHCEAPFPPAQQVTCVCRL